MKNPRLLTMSALGLLICAGCDSGSFDVSPTPEAGAEASAGSGGTAGGTGGSGGTGGVAGSGGDGGSGGIAGSAGSSGAAGAAPGGNGGAAGHDAGDASTSCPSGTADCDTNPSNGCEVDTQSDVAHCGACDAACSDVNATPACVQGQCQLACTLGFDDCDDDVATGCEQDVHGDLANCGACGQLCSVAGGGEAACSGGVCGVACDPGRADCDAKVANGCETDTHGDPTNCGGCGRACSNEHATPSCSNGACVAQCNPSWGNCDGDVLASCETDLGTNPLHCGTCNHACSGVHGTAMCTNAGCWTACDVGFGDCDGNVSTGCETDTKSSVQHCGGCNAGCGPYANAVPSCVASACKMTCNMGWQDCDNAKSNGCEIDLKTDPLNCGACWHSCWGAACVDGMCQPINVATSQDRPTGIALNDTSIFWATQGSTGATGTLRMRSKTGTSTVTIASSLAAPQGVGATNSFVAWANAGVGTVTGSIQYADLTAAGNPVSTSASSQTGAFGLSLLGGSVCWTRNSDVFAKKLAVATINTVASSQPTPLGITQDDSFIYWATGAGIRRGGVSKPVEVVVSTASAAWDVAVDDSHVYWTSTASTFRAPKTAFATAQDLSQGVGSQGRGIAVHDGIVYWCAQSSIWKVPAGGGTAIEIAKNLQNPWEIAVDGTFVYWTENVSAGSVRKVAK